MSSIRRFLHAIGDEARRKITEAQQNLPKSLGRDLLSDSLLLKSPFTWLLKAGSKPPGEVSYPPTDLWRDWSSKVLCDQRFPSTASSLVSASCWLKALVDSRRVTSLSLHKGNGGSLLLINHLTVKSSHCWLSPWPPNATLNENYSFWPG